MMFADVSRHQHRHHFTSPLHSPQRYSHHYSSSDTLFHDLQQASNNGSPRSNVGGGGPFPEHPQYVLPQQQRQPQAVMQNPRPVSLPVTVDSSEHMLRRKTPNGTLSAAYDGAPSEWVSRPHTSKHILLSGSEAVGHRASQMIAINSPQGPNTFTRPAAVIRSDSGPAQLWSRSVASPQFYPDYLMNTDDGALKQQRLQNAYYTPSLDSMLHQAPINQQIFFGPGGCQQVVPTLLQPIWPPSIGPTSSNAQGRFGPYWPDGSFEPYRPAPIRDSRFHSQFASINLNGPPEPQATYDLAWSRTHPSFAVSRNNEVPSRISRESDYHGEISILPQEQMVPLRQMSNQSSLRQKNDMDSATSYAPQGRTAQMKYPSLRGDVVPWPSSPASAQFVSSSTAGKLVSPSSQQFKTKVLLWAHRIYLNLVHQSRRQNQLKQSSEKGHSQSAIYPNPSRHTTDLRNLANEQSVQGFSTNSPASADASICGRTSRDGGREGSGHDLRWPHNQCRSTFHERHDRGLRLSEAPQTITSDKFSGHHRQSSLYPRPSPFPTPMLTPQQLQPPGVEAKAAMDMLDRLCQESGWQWVDGILLGGCLAYGLEQFSLALRWYERVLACDANNVEALSNMAAAHLSLKNGKEAEKCWFQAVKLRPSYFEAVEHLVGLLCGDQRGRDAVKVIEYVESSLKVREDSSIQPSWDESQEQNGSNKLSRNSLAFDADKCIRGLSLSSDGFGSSGYRIPATDNGRMLALIHAKGNMLYALGDNAGAAKAFEDAIMIGSGRRSEGIAGLIRYILSVFTRHILSQRSNRDSQLNPCEAILLLPNVALKTADLVFPIDGQLPGLRDVPDGQSKKAAVSVASNSLLSLAKIYQDGMSSSGAPAQSPKVTPGVPDILALYYLSLSLQPSPSTANNVGILLASVQQSAPQKPSGNSTPDVPAIPGVTPGSGIALALAYYNYGLNLDNRHAHLYTNLGSLLKDIGQLGAAIKMYEQAVNCDGKFDIALANLANAVKDQGRISDAIGYYERAVKSNPDFAEAVCGLANALNSVCSWKGRGGVIFANKRYDRWHVDEQGMLTDANVHGISSSGWIAHVVTIVEKQLKDGQSWGKGFLRSKDAEGLFSLKLPTNSTAKDQKTQALVLKAINDWAGQDWEGARVVRIIERATKRFGWQMYQDRYVHKLQSPTKYARPNLPASLVVPSAPTVLPFHTFTCPLTANQIRKISQRNGLRISCSTLRAAWLPDMVFDPPAPPSPYLKVGYVSSDFNNHPLAHLMQSVFGFHDQTRVKAFCYATTASDNSSHREQISREAPVFCDVSSWPVDKLVKQIVDDGIHILINLNGYTRGARNEVFAARPAPIQMSFMGFAGTLGAEWCDYLLADEIAVPPSMLRPYRSNVDLIDQTQDNNYGDDSSDWVYGENIIYARDTFFCCDHRQSAPDSQERQLSWPEEQTRRRKMRKELFPNLSDDTVILGNFNQLYKIEPTTFRTWLRILQAIPNAVLWLLRFPDLGEENLRQTAIQWASASVADRIIFTDVAPKHQHISRARVCDLFLDTPECNAHTTAADVLWSGTPLLTLPRYEYKMCSRMAASILRGALPRGEQGDIAAIDLTAHSDETYEAQAIKLGTGLAAVLKGKRDNCRLLELRKMLYEGRWSSALFDTRRWVRDLEAAYEEAWRRWVAGEGGDIWLDEL